jgi:hypothetical protein
MTLGGSKSVLDSAAMDGTKEARMMDRRMVTIFMVLKPEGALD